MPRYVREGSEEDAEKDEGIKSVPCGEQLEEGGIIVLKVYLKGCLGERDLTCVQSQEVLH